MKLSKSLIFLSAGLLLASCSQEDVMNNGGQEACSMRFSVNLPESFGTRALGDGTSAKNLYVAVFDADNDNSFIMAPQNSDNSPYTFNDQGSATVNLDLVAGKNYIISFFAYAPGAFTANDGTDTSTSSTVYTLDTSTGDLTVDYTAMQNDDNNRDNYDCFYFIYNAQNVSNNSLSANVVLTRPIGQINWGTNDASSPLVIENYGSNLENLQYTFTASDIPNTLNLLKGTVSGTTSVSLNNFTVPSGPFPSVSTTETYIRVAMQYVLAPASTSTISNFELTVSNGASQSNKITVSSAPIQANYQTNIYGSLLTSSTSFVVTKSAGWNTSDDFNISLVWDGTTTYPSIPEEPATVPINKPSDLAGLADLVNGTANNGSSANDFEGYTFQLAADFDMAGKEFPMIGNATRSNNSSTGASFKGTFDGNNMTISNLVINSSESGDVAVGMFSSVEGSEAIVKDLNLENITINAPGAKNVGLVGILSDGAQISNVNVKSGTINGSNGTGAVVGRVMSSGTVSGCNNGATVTSNGTNTGGVVGAAYYTSSDGIQVTVENCHNTGAVTGAGEAVGGVVGFSAANISGCTNTATITNSSKSTGGVVGEQTMAGTISQCENSGEVIGGPDYGAGGIVGWVRYNGTTTAYPYQEIITVTGCNNSAKVSGGTGVGGIVGMWYAGGECYGNTNTSPSITGNQFIAGIVGGSQIGGTSFPSPDMSLVPEDEQEFINNLYVQNNYSTTTQAQMGGKGSPFIYVNNATQTYVTGNSMTNSEVTKTEFTRATEPYNQNSTNNAWSTWTNN